MKLRAARPGKRAALWCGWPSNTMCSYTSSLITSTSVGASRSCRRSISSRVQTVALGLCGELTMMARVRGVSAAAILSKSGRKVPGVSGTRTTRAAGQFDVGHVAVVAGLQHDHLVARPHDGQDGGDDGLRGAGRDGDLGGRVVAVAVHALSILAGDRLAQRRHAGHRRVLVVAARHRVGHGVAPASGRSRNPGSPGPG